MRIKYSPVKWNPYAKDSFSKNTLPDSKIEYVNENIIKIDGEEIEFDATSHFFPDIGTLTKGLIQEAHRNADTNELFLTVRRFYTKDWKTWYKDDYTTIG